MTTPVARQLAEVAGATDWAAVPPAVQDRVRDRVLDAISTAIAARDVPATIATLAATDEFPGPCTVLPTGGRASAADAMLVNGTASHAVLFEDINFAGSDHPGPVIVFAALAAAEAGSSWDGRERTLTDLLTAVLVGYEVQLRLGAVCAEALSARGLRTTSVLGTIGAAAAIGRLMDLGRDQLAAAITLAANLAFGFVEGFAHGTMEPYLQAGLAARNGLTAARLARGGAQVSPLAFEGAGGFLTALCGRTGNEPIRITERWTIMDVACKPYPISAAKIGLVDSALELRESGLEPGEIDRVEVHLTAAAQAFPGSDNPGPFPTMNAAQDSAQFCVAAALLGRPVHTLAPFREGLHEPAVAELSRRITVVAGPPRLAGRVTVVTHDGRHASTHADGAQRQIPTVASMGAKLTELARGWWPDGHAATVVEALRGAGGEEPVRRLSGLLRAGPAPVHPSAGPRA